LRVVLAERVQNENDPSAQMDIQPGSNEFLVENGLVKPTVESGTFCSCFLLLTENVQESFFTANCN